MFVMTKDGHIGTTKLYYIKDILGRHTEWTQSAVQRHKSFIGHY